MKLFLLICLFLVSCKEEASKSAAPLVRLDMQRPMMGTLFRVVTYTSDREKARQDIENAFDFAEKFAARATDYEPKSELNQLCASPKNTPVQVSDELFKVLVLAKDLALQTKGIFDPTLGPLTHLWRESRRTKTLPGEEEIAEARSRCGIQFVVFDSEKKTITLLKDNMQLDLGGIAKGYAADLIFDHLKAAGYSQSLIAAAGDLRLGDAPPEKEGWTIALRTFRLTPTKSLVLKNCAVSTSGDLYQSVQIGKDKYSHLIDLKTGLGLTSRRAASVIAPMTKLTDPLATAACLLDDPEELLKSDPKISLRVLYEDSNKAPIVTGKFLAK